MRRILGLLIIILCITGVAYPFANGSRMNGMFAAGPDNYQNQVRKGFSDYPQGLTFYKDFTNSQTNDANSLNADYAIGSPIATYSVSRSATNPATYANTNGVVSLVTTSNTPRIRSGYYDLTGFHTSDSNGQGAAGLMIEAAGTNLLTETSGTSSSSGLWTTWYLTNNTGTTATQSQVDASAITSIANSYSQRLQLSGQTSTSKPLRLCSFNTSAGSVRNENTVTVSCWVRSQTGMSGCDFKFEFTVYCQNGKVVNTYTSSAISLSSSWIRAFYTSVVAGKTGSGTATRLSNLVTVVSASHGIADGSYITLSGFATINGSGTITVVNANTFTLTINGSDVAIAESGTWTWAVSKLRYVVGCIGGIDTGDTVDFEIWGPQAEVNEHTTSFIPTTTAALTRNEESLAYALSNATAAKETIFLRWLPIRTPILGGSAILLDSDTKRRRISESTSGTRNSFFPNATDSGNCTVDGNNSLPTNTSVTYTLVCDTDASSIHARFFVNGVASNNTPTDTDNFETNAWGTYFYLGSNNAKVLQHPSVWKRFARFNRELSASEITQVVGLMSN